LQHVKVPKPGNARVWRRRRRVGADAAFAKAMARAEFGRFYTDERELREVRRSLQRAKARREAKTGAAPAAQARIGAVSREPDSRTRAKPKLWHHPSFRERRTELAEARAKLMAAAAARKGREPGAEK
jgi:hypothetical protein